jgi:hypothetical protein
MQAKTSNRADKGKDQVTPGASADSDALDEALEESFPASDPPARSPGHAGSPEGHHGDGAVSPSASPKAPSRRQ